MSTARMVELEVLEALAQSSDDAILAADEDQRIILFNQAAGHLFGYTVEAALGMELSALIPLEAREIHRTHVDSFGSGETAWRKMSERDEVAGLRSDGTTFPADIHIMTAASGASPIYAAVVRDTQAARRSESLLRATMEGTSSSTGAGFLHDSVRVLGNALGCQMAYISEPVPGDPATHRVLARWAIGNRGGFDDYRIEGTPGETALTEDLFVVSDGVVDRYPDDESLRSIGARSWVSIRMLDQSGHYMAHLGLVGSEPCFLTPADTSTLRIFAARIGAELERLHSDDELERLQDFGRNMMTNGPSGVGHVDLRAGNAWSNSQFASIVGRSLSEVLDSGWQSLVHPDDLAPVSDGVRALREGTGILDSVVRVLHPNGTVRWIHIHATSSVDAADSVAEIAVFVLDLSTEREAQEELRTLAQELDLRKSELELILKSFLDFAFRFRADGTYLDCWAGDPRVLLATPDELIGTNVRDSLEPEVARQFLQAITDTIETREVTAIEFSVSSDRGITHYEARFSHLHADEVLVVTRDVTAMKVIENQLVHARTVRSLGRMAGGIAHDFNNVLHIIRGHAAALERNLDNPQNAKTSIDAITGAVDRTSTLIDRLMAVSDHAPDDPEPMPIDEFLASLGPALAELLPPEIGLELVLGCGDSLVAINGSQFERAVLNLATNARDAMPTGGRLRIATSTLSRSHLAQIEVSDTGDGMTPEIAERIFEPFFTTKPPGVGNGLGLATAFDAITTAGGTLEVDTTPGEQTTFTITLPIVSVDSVEAPAGPTSTDEGHGPTVLLVEDEPEVRELGADALRLMGYRVIEASSGEDARALIAAGHTFSVLLTDVVMGEVSGPDLAHQLKISHPDLPVVFMSGYSADLIPPDVLERSALLSKPFSDTELRSAIERALNPDPSGTR